MDLLSLLFAILSLSISVKTDTLENQNTEPEPLPWQNHLEKLDPGNNPVLDVVYDEEDDDNSKDDQDTSANNNKSSQQDDQQGSTNEIQQDATGDANENSIKVKSTQTPPSIKPADLIKRKYQQAYEYRLTDKEESFKKFYRLIMKQKKLWAKNELTYYPLNFPRDEALEDLKMGIISNHKLDATTEIYLDHEYKDTLENRNLNYHGKNFID